MRSLCKQYSKNDNWSEKFVFLSHLSAIENVLMRENTMEINKTLDLGFIRSQFPAFELSESRDLIFFGTSIAAAPG